MHWELYCTVLKQERKKKHKNLLQAEDNLAPMLHVKHAKIKKNKKKDFLRAEVIVAGGSSSSCHYVQMN